MDHELTLKHNGPGSMYANVYLDDKYIGCAYISYLTGEAVWVPTNEFEEQDQNVVVRHEQTHAVEAEVDRYGLYLYSNNPDHID